MSPCQSRDVLTEASSRVLASASRNPGQRRSSSLATSGGTLDPSSSAGSTQYANASQSIHREAASARRTGATNFADALALQTSGKRRAVSSQCSAAAFHSSNDGYRIGLAFFHRSTHSDQQTSAL